VLTGPRLGYDAGLAQAVGQEGLPEGVVDLVGTGVQEVLALQIDAPSRRQAPREVEGRGPAGIRSPEMLELPFERRVVASLTPRSLQLVQGRDQRLGHEAVPESSEPPLLRAHGRSTGRSLP
jgi:hypothetical protein